MESLLTPKTEPGVIPRVSLLPKKKPVIPSAVPRARFQKAKPNINNIPKGPLNSNQKDRTPNIPKDAANSKESQKSTDERKEPVTPVKAIHSVLEPITNTEISEVLNNVIPSSTLEPPTEAKDETSTLNSEKSLRTTGNITFVDLSSEEVSQPILVTNECTAEVERTGRAPQEVINDAVENQPPSHAMPPPAVDRVANKHPTLTRLLHSPRKRANNRELIERKKRVQSYTDPPPRSEMTMNDLIYWNPRTSPMKCLKPVSISADKSHDKSVELAIIDPKETEQEDSLLSSGPKVIVADDGQIVIDESSLVVQRKKTISSLDPEIDNEEATYSSFRRKSSRHWSKKETMQFYEALTIVGTDFALMANIMHKRCRRELKLKYKKEEKQNMELVHKAIYKPQTFDDSILLDFEEVVDEPAIIPHQPKSKTADKRLEEKNLRDERRKDAREKKWEEKNLRNEKRKDAREKRSEEIGQITKRKFVAVRERRSEYYRPDNEVENDDSIIDPNDFRTYFKDYEEYIRMNAEYLEGQPGNAANNDSEDPLAQEEATDNPGDDAVDKSRRKIRRTSADSNFKLITVNYVPAENANAGDRDWVMDNSDEEMDCEPANTPHSELNTLEKDTRSTDQMLQDPELSSTVDGFSQNSSLVAHLPSALPKLPPPPIEKVTDSRVEHRDIVDALKQPKEEPKDIKNSPPKKAAANDPAGTLKRKRIAKKATPNVALKSPPKRTKSPLVAFPPSSEPNSLPLSSISVNSMAPISTAKQQKETETVVSPLESAILGDTEIACEMIIDAVVDQFTFSTSQPKKRRPKPNVPKPRIPNYLNAKHMHSPSFSHFTPVEEPKTYERISRHSNRPDEESSSPPDTELSVPNLSFGHSNPKTYTRTPPTHSNPSEEASSSSLCGTELSSMQVPMFTPERTSKDDSALQTTLNISSSQSISIPITPQRDGEDTGERMEVIFAKSPNSDNTLHMFMLTKGDGSGLTFPNSPAPTL